MKETKDFGQARMGWRRRRENDRGEKAFEARAVLEGDL